MHHPLKPVPKVIVTPQTQIFRKYQKNLPFFYAGFNNPSKARKTNRSTSSHLSQPDTPPHHTQASPFTRKPWKDSCKPLSTLPVAIFVQQNCNRAPKHGGGPWWQDIWEISAIQYVVLQLIIKKSEIEKNKKTRVRLKILQNRKYINPGKKNGSVSRQPKKKNICRYLRHQDAQATEAIGDGTASIVLGDARCFHPLIDW